MTITSLLVVDLPILANLIAKMSTHLFSVDDSSLNAPLISNHFDFILQSFQM